MEAAVPSFLDVNFDDVPEMVYLDNNEEVEVEVKQVKMGVGKSSGKPYARLQLGVPERPEVHPFFEYLNIPNEDDDQSARQFKLDYIRKAARAFGVDVSNGIDFEAFVGERAYIIAGRSEDPEYGTQNRVREYVQPR